MTLERRENDIYDGEERVALIDINGHLKMTKGNAEKREQVEAWLDEREMDEALEAAKAAGGQVPDAKAEKPAKSGEIPECPAEDVMLGDKTPAVVAWWFEHHPEQAEEKYKNRKVVRP